MTRRAHRSGRTRPEDRRPAIADRPGGGSEERSLCVLAIGNAILVDIEVKLRPAIPPA